ncbi:MAG: hypothetical protein O3B13_08850 [Planctomycetota bacterium]|nr:hypothetical protein [Planctomycetota bacterium]MDA1163196.1 hypothetical protein [Planctomycetota bacterium]
MQTRRLQQVFAFAALLMLPWPALRPMAQSITFGDLLLVPAILLNVDQLGKIRGWQVPLLLAVPFILISQVADPDGSIIDLLQVLYIFAVVLPFGWVAFVNFRPRTIATIILLSLSASAIVGGLQLAGVIGQVGSQSIWSLSGGATRAAGLNISCSGLCLSMSPLFALLLYVPDYRRRLGFLLLIAIGLLASLAKSAIFASVGLTYYFVREPNRRGIVMVAAIMFASITGLFVASPAIRKTTSMVYDTLTYRVDHAGFSIYERTSTMRFAAGFLSRCSVIGMGTEGTTKVLSQHFGNTVHVFHFGLVLVAGIPAALLIWTGFGLLIASCFQAGQHPVAIMVICHLLALCSMTLLLTSFQYMPFVIAASVLNYQLCRNEQVADVRLQSARDALFRRRVMPTAA